MTWTTRQRFLSSLGLLTSITLHVALGCSGEESTPNASNDSQTATGVSTPSGAIGTATATTPAGGTTGATSSGAATGAGGATSMGTAANADASGTVANAGATQITGGGAGGLDTSNLGGGTSGTAGAGSVVANGGGTSSGGSANAGAGTATAGGATGVAGADSGSEDLRVALVSTFTAATWVELDAATTSVNRVELPAWFTVAAMTDASGVASVEFLVGGSRVSVDDTAPYQLSEDSWDPGFGSVELSVVAYPMAGAQGTPLASVTRSFEITATGLDAAFTRQDDSANQQWVTANHGTAMATSSFAASGGFSLPYRLFTPPSYDAGVKYPLLVYLHGRGERGTDNRQQIYSNSALFMGPRSIISPNGQHDFPAFIVVPQCSDKSEDEEWANWEGNSPDNPFGGLGQDGSYTPEADPSDSGRAVLELVQSLLTEFSIEPSRIYMTGESMGGFGTWEYTYREPNTFAAAAPMAGYSDPTQAEKVKHIPYWVFHGGSDGTNPVAGSRNMTAALEAAGGNVIYTEYAGLDHVPTFTEAWSNEPELLPWMFSQRIP